MRRVKLSLACSLDLRIAAADGAIDWIRMDADYGMTAFMASVDTALIGRKTYDMACSTGNRFFSTMKNYVFSKSLRAGKSGEVEIIAEDAADFTHRLKTQSGKDIWLFGGYALTASLLAAELVDEIRLVVYPVLLGGGPTVFGPLEKRQNWKLESCIPHKNSAIVLHYSKA
jgi:dihydrofolate reductase